ncbi:MAG: sortase [Candidatus Paceibacterota bacterium]|jgi:LPXTG-site transpeptidase (sortase) family protein
MTGITTSIVWLVEAGMRAYERKWRFLGVFAVVLVSSVFVLGRFGLLPEAAPKEVATKAASPATAAVADATPATQTEEPIKVEAPKIGLAVTVANPSTTNIKVLDEYLLTGAVRYPTSALLGETGNVVIFGHSSYLPVVNNKSYKAFNGIQKLVVGDSVVVSSAGRAYTYSVRSVTKASATDAGIPLAISGRVLTLATCDSFGAKSDRFIVVADFVESHSVSI